MTGVTVTPKTNNLEVGATRQLNVTTEPSDIDVGIVYTSNDEAVATVDDTGLVTAVSEGTAEVAVDADGVTDTVTVNVTEPDEGDD